MPQIIRAPDEILTERLRLRPVRPSDAALVELYASDARVARMTERIPHPYPPSLAESFVDRVTSGTPGEICWAIEVQAEPGSTAEANALIGTIILRFGSEGSARVGYWVAPAFWNTGYASEAVEAVVAHAPCLGLREITARVFQDNAASVRVLIHAGFAYVDDGEAYSLGRGGVVATHNYRREIPS